MTLDRLFAGENKGSSGGRARDARAGAEVEPERAADEAGWRYVLLDSSSPAAKATFFECCAEAFDLPSWSGATGTRSTMPAGLDLDEPTVCSWCGRAGRCWSTVTPTRSTPRRGVP